MEQRQKTFILQRLTLNIKVKVMADFTYVSTATIWFDDHSSFFDEEKAAYALTNGEMQRIVYSRNACDGNITILIFRMGQG